MGQDGGLNETLTEPISPYTLPHLLKCDLSTSTMWLLVLATGSLITIIVSNCQGENKQIIKVHGHCQLQPKKEALSAPATFVLN